MIPRWIRFIGGLLLFLLLTASFIAAITSGQLSSGGVALLFIVFLVIVLDYLMLAFGELRAGRSRRQM